MYYEWLIWYGCKHISLALPDRFFRLCWAGKEGSDEQPIPFLVSRSQTAFFRFSLWWRKKGSRDLTIEFACDKIPSFWGAFIAGDEPKRGANDLWGDASY